MSDDDAPEREFDLAHFPADSRNFAAELAQLQDQEMKHMAGLKKNKDEAERAAAIKDYKQVVDMQRFLIMNEMKVAVKVAKQKMKASQGGGKSDGRRAEFITFCTVRGRRRIARAPLRRDGDEACRQVSTVQE